MKVFVYSLTTVCLLLLVSKVYTAAVATWKQMNCAEPQAPYINPNITPPHSVNVGDVLRTEVNIRRQGSGLIGCEWRLDGMIINTNCNYTVPGLDLGKNLELCVYIYNDGSDEISCSPRRTVTQQAKKPPLYKSYQLDLYR